MPMFKKTKIPQLIRSTTIFDSFFKIRKDELAFPNSGQSYDYYSLDTKFPAISILAQTKNETFVINKEYRHPTKEYLLSCPGGYLCENETAEAGGARELLEETGYTAERFFLMGSAYPYPGISSQKLYYIGAIGAEKIQEPSLETEELLTTQLLSLDNIHKNIKNGIPLDGILCAALFFWDHFSTQ